MDGETAVTLYTQMLPTAEKRRYRLWMTAMPTDNTANHNSGTACQRGREQMAARHALVFIGACGIAVRAIAPGSWDKLHDSPVLVADEMGKYVIPLVVWTCGWSQRTGGPSGRSIGCHTGDHHSHRLT